VFIPKEKGITKKEKRKIEIERNKKARIDALNKK
jgi:hypothetical protein